MATASDEAKETPGLCGKPVRKPDVAVACVLTAWLLAAATAICGWLHHHEIQKLEIERDVLIRGLETAGWQHIDNRRWREADASFAAISRMIPGCALAGIGRALTAAGRKEEETQFIAYWTGQALAELEAGRLDDAAAAIRRVTENHPQHAEAAEINRRIGETRIHQEIQSAILDVRFLIESRNWDSAVEKSGKLAARHPGHPDINLILRESQAGLERHRHDLALAASLYQKAAALDTGQFDQQALDWLREAHTLAPGDPRISSLLEKMASYTRTVRVPEDFPTPLEALAGSRPNDRIVIAKGTWQGPLAVPHAVELQGADPGESVISCPAGAGNAITFHAGRSRVSGMAFRHETLQVEPGARFSAAMVVGGSVEFVNCRFTRSNGHGVAVTHGAAASLRRCQLRDNAWNGLAVIGKGSTAAMEESDASENFHNGVEIWQGAGAQLTRNRITANSRNGIHAGQDSGSLAAAHNTVGDNREFGICLSSAEGGTLRDNTIRANRLGGILVRAKAGSVVIDANESVANLGPDLALESGLPSAPYSSNSLTPNRSDALRPDAQIDP